MKIAKEEKVKQKKKQIIEALKLCLSRDVYSRITVQSIADESGFSKGGVLHYFSTKEDIYLELISDIFKELEYVHLKILEEGLKETDVGPHLSALVGVESFIIDKVNIRIIINVMLYALEDDKIRVLINDFLVKHRLFYRSIIQDAGKNSLKRRKSDVDADSIARIVQTIVLFVGILETIDDTEIDNYGIVKFLAAILK